MNDDTLLDRAGRAARDAARRDPLDKDWDRLSDDSLSDDEHEALLERCGDERLAARAEAAFRPFDDGDRADFVAAALAARSTSSLPTAPLDDDLDAGDTADTADGADSGNASHDRPDGSDGEGDSTVVPFRPRTQRVAWVLGLAASAVLAVGVVLSSGVFSPGGSGTLPGYGYEVRGTAEVRSQTSRGVRVDQTFELILTPDTALESPAQVRLFVADGSALRPLETLSMDMASSGAARVTASAATLPVGQIELVAVVSRGLWPETLAAAEQPGQWEAVRIPLTVLPVTRN